MSPILGIWASQNYSRIPTTGFVSIATQTVGSGGTSSVTFSGIPQVYKHLQLRCLGRTTAAVDNDVALITFNSDTGSNYVAHDLRGNGGVVASGAYTSLTASYLQRFAGGNQSASMFGAVVVDFLDYADTNKFKTFRDLGGYDFNGSGNMYLSSGLWRSTSAITSMTMTPSSGNWAQYTQFALYGIQGA